ncbi:MAG: hypothetical protein K8U57_26745 [Planctomycetes bacterium]|nr:hypothetical protein [Planctomycetota bacterium]
MRHLRVILIGFLLTANVGCQSLRDAFGIKPREPHNNNTGVVQKVTAEQLVGYLNTQASRLQTLSYGDVTVSAKEGDGIRGAIKEAVYPNLRGNLSASQPRNFRMVAKGGLVDVKVDLGSNPEQFWVYFTMPQMQPMYVFASHEDFESGKAKIPSSMGNMPIDPDWLMQALGMTTFSPGLPYTSTSDEKARTYTLSWPTTTPNKVAIRKEIVFLADDADAIHNQAQVKRHVVRDMKGKVLCYAEVKSAKTVPTGGSDPQTGRPYVVQYPTELLLRWEEQKFEMTLKLDAGRVNGQLTAQDNRRLFELPNIPGANPLNLAEARFDNTGRP